MYIYMYIYIYIYVMCIYVYIVVGMCWPLDRLCVLFGLSGPGITAGVAAVGRVVCG